MRSWLNVTGMDFQTLRWVAGLAVLGWALAGCWTDSPPVFQGVALEPVSLRFAGGQVRIQARVTDDKGLTRVGGMVLRGNREIVALEVKQPLDQADRFSYEAVFQVPPNSNNDGAAIKYTVRLIAVDTGGQESRQQVNLLALAPPPPPPPPPQ